MEGSHRIMRLVIAAFAVAALSALTASARPADPAPPSTGRPVVNGPARCLDVGTSLRADGPCGWRYGVHAPPTPLATANEAPVPVARSVDDGFDWTSAAIGGGVASGLMVLLGAGGAGYRRRHVDATP